MPLNVLQQQLQQIYEVDVPHRVEDFLITDRQLAQSIDTSPNAREVAEKLLVVQEGDCLDLALYLDAEVIGRLERDDPTACLHGGNIADLCTVLEGISHFLYLTWNAGFDRGVSLLELEMQAEVDKYVAAAFLYGRQGGGKVPSALFRWLFADPSFDHNLDRKSMLRYRHANYYAAKFCSRLIERYWCERRSGSLVNELRRFYRLPERAKIVSIETQD